MEGGGKKKESKGRPIQLPETLLTHSEGEVELMRILPKSGILSLDFITLNHNDKSRWMKRYSFRFSFFKKEDEEEEAETEENDHSGEESKFEASKDRIEAPTTPAIDSSASARHLQGMEHRIKACAIFERTKNGPGSFEFCLNIEVDGIPIPQNQLKNFEIPSSGSTLQFEVASYVAHHPVSHSSFLSICENIAQQSSSSQRQSFIECIIEGDDREDHEKEEKNEREYDTAHLTSLPQSSSHLFYLTSDQVEILLLTIPTPKERWTLLKLLCHRIVDPVNLIFAVHDLLHVRKHKTMLLRWIKREIPTLSQEKNDAIERQKIRGQKK